MELRQEPRLRQEITLTRIAFVTTTIIGLVAGIIFFLNGMFTSKYSGAAVISVGSTTTLNTNSGDPFTGVSDGDTIYIQGKLNVNSDYSALSGKKVTFILDGSTAEMKVFKDNTLALGTGSSIILKNGAKLEYTGNCSSGTEISVGSNVVANCNGSSGAMSFANVNTAGGLGSIIVELPVAWLSFQATLRGENEVILNWATASEENNSHFDIEYSIDGSNWMNAGTVKTAAENGFSNSILNYTYTHYIYESANEVYYRIKQTDFDEKFDFSDLVAVNINVQDDIRIGTLGGGKINVKVANSPTNQGEIKIYTMDGQLLQRVPLDNSNVISVDKPGYYIIEVVRNGDIQRIKQAIT